MSLFRFRGRGRTPAPEDQELNSEEPTAMSDTTTNPSGNEQRQQQPATAQPANAAAQQPPAGAEAELRAQIEQLQGQLAEKSTKDAAASAAEIAQLATESGFPAMAAGMIRDGLSVEDAKKRLEGCKEIKGMVDQARQTCPALSASLAEQYVAAGKTKEEARADLFDRMVAAQEPSGETITNQHQATTGAVPGTPQGQKAIEDLWSARIEKRHPQTKAA